jgi:hypothetical protein
VKEAETPPTVNDIKEEIRKIQISLNFGSDMKFYIALNSIYDINIVKKWKTYSKLFNGFIESDVDKVAAQGHLLLVVIDYFMKKFPDIKKYNATFLKLLFDGDTFNESFLKDWYYKKVRLDKSSPLYKKSLEKDYKQSVE